MTKRTPREEDLLGRAAAVEKAIHTLDLDWPASRIEELSMTEQGRALVSIYRHDRQKLVDTKLILDAMMVDADGYATIFRLAATRKWAFDSVVALAREELARPADAPSLLEPPAEQARAA